MKLGRNWRNLFVVAAALTLGACGAPAVFGTDHRTAYTPGEVLRAVNDGELRVEAFGSFGSDPRITGDQLEATLARTLQQHGPNWFRTTYTTAATGEGEPRHRLRWAFNVPAGFHNNDACRDGLAEAAAGWNEDTGLVVAAFCRSGRDASARLSGEGLSLGPSGQLLSFARGSLGNITDIDSPAFGRWVGSMSRGVLPPRNPNRDRGRDCSRRRVCP